MVDLENTAALQAELPAAQRQQLQSLVGELLFFSPLRPMRRWRLNLAREHDRVLAQRLQQMSARERRRRAAAALPDTSQHGNGEMFRHVVYLHIYLHGDMSMCICTHMCVHIHTHVCV